MTVIRWLRDPPMSARYTLVALFGVAMWGLCAALILHRQATEPIVRLLHTLFLHRAGPYEAAFYNAYVAFAGIMGLLTFATVAYGLATKTRTDRKIDRYLADRLPQHTEEIRRDSSPFPLDGGRAGNGGWERSRIGHRVDGGASDH